MLHHVVLAAVLAAAAFAAPLSKPASRAAAFFGRQLNAHERAMCQPFYSILEQAPPSKNAKRGDQANLCGNTFVGSQGATYYVVTDPTAQIDSETACNSVGYVWAGIDSPTDIAGIGGLVDVCGGTLANIAYYLGVYPAGQPDICAYVSNDELVDFMGAPNICSTASVLVLCTAEATQVNTIETTLTTTPTITSVSSIDATETSTNTSFTITTTSFGVTTDSTRVLTSTVWSPVVVTVVSTSTTTTTSISGTVTFTITSSTVLTTTTTVSTLEFITVTETVLPTCPGQRLSTCPCRPGKGGFVIVENPLPYYQAQCACESLGLDFAAITDANIEDARSVLSNCLDCRKSAWIASWENINNDECLALYSDGNIAVPEHCNHKRPVLCKVIDHSWTSSSCSSGSSSSSSCGCYHKAAAPEAANGKAEQCGCPPPPCESSSSSSSSSGCPCIPVCESSSSSSSSSCGCPCPPTCESSSSSSSCPPTCESSSSSSSCGCPCPPPTCESSSSSSSCGCPCPPPTCESSSSSSSCGCPPPPPPPCPCDCRSWTSESCSSLSEWEACDQCQVCCCDQIFYHKKNPFAAGQSPNPNLLKSRKTEPETPTKPKAIAAATNCAKTILPQYEVIISQDTYANQIAACQGYGGALLADLTDADAADLGTLFSVCNLSNGAYFATWDDVLATPCGFVYGIPGIFGYARFLSDVTSCDSPRGAICKIPAAQATTTENFGTNIPQTTTSEFTSISTLEFPTTLETTSVYTTTTQTTFETTFVVPDISFSYTSTSTSISVRTSPSQTTTRTTSVTDVTTFVNTTETTDTTVYTTTQTLTSTDFTGTTTITTTVTLIGKRK